MGIRLLVSKVWMCRFPCVCALCLSLVESLSPTIISVLAGACVCVLKSCLHVLQSDVCTSSAACLNAAADTVGLMEEIDSDSSNLDDDAPDFEVRA